MNDQVFTDVLEQLLALRDNAYQAFQAKLMPTVPPERRCLADTPHDFHSTAYRTTDCKQPEKEKMV